MANNEEKRQLSYEELKAYAEQTTARAKQIYEENTKLKQAIQELRTQMNYSDISLAFKVLDHKDVFSEEFVKKVKERLELVLTPTEPTKGDAGKKEEDKKEEDEDKAHKEE